MSLQTSRSQNSYSIDASTQLKDAGAVTASGAGQVSAANRVLDFGNATDVAHTKGNVVIDVSAIDFATGDETYQILVQLSDDASGNGSGFDAGDTVVCKALVPMGNLDTLLAGVAQDDDSATGRVVIGVDNEHKGSLFRFMRVAHVIAGTTPSINYTAFLAESLV